MKIKVNALDKLFSLVIREAAGYVCQSCGKVSPPGVDNGFMDAAHNVSRRVRLTRYDPRNVVCLCRGCHMKQTNDPHLHVKFMRKHFGEDYQNMRDKMNVMQKLTKKDLESLKAHYKKELKVIEGFRLTNLQGQIKVAIPEEIL